MRGAECGVRGLNGEAKEGRKCGVREETGGEGGEVERRGWRSKRERWGVEETVEE